MTPFVFSFILIHHAESSLDALNLFLYGRGYYVIDEFRNIGFERKELMDKDFDLEVVGSAF
jgi:hypothetical protein